MSTHKSSRRQFVKTSAVLSAGYWIADRAAAESKSPNERVAFACIGVDGKGHEDSNDAARLGDVVAFCEIDSKRLAAATRRVSPPLRGAAVGKLTFPKAKTFNDFRKLLDTMHKSIDAVTVSVPDHIHAPVAAMAMRRGLHCFVQKPRRRYDIRRSPHVLRSSNLARDNGSCWPRRWAIRARPKAICGRRPRCCARACWAT